MSCSPFDLRDYFLQELADPQRRQVESHVKACQSCREELDRLQLTQTALFSLREEEIPQRIAFVSDAIFEPSPLRRFLRDFWGSAARLGFASAAMLSAALVVFALHKPAEAPVVQLASPGVVTRAFVSESDMRPLIDAAVARKVAEAVAESEARQAVKTKQLMAQAEDARQGLLLAADELDRAQKRAGTLAINRGWLAPPNEGAIQ
jgi:anti-sigma factor RsiW